MLEIKNLSFRYNKSSPLILDDISFTLNESEISIILSPNGEGKTTIIKLINGILKKTSGDISYNDIDLEKLKTNEKAKLISYVAQENDIPYLTVYEVIMLGRTPYIRFKESKNDIKIVNDIIDEMHLNEFRNRDYNTLSGGEKQLVMIARALAQEPKIIMLDEPTSNLDISKSINVSKILKELTKEKNLIVLISMHDINLALNLGDNFMLLKDTKIIQMGSTKIINEKIIKDVFNIDVKIKNERNKKYIVYENI